MKKIPRKDYPKVAFVLLVIVFISTVALLIWRLGSAGISEKYKAEISLVSGKAETSSQSGAWKELKTNETISQGETVRVIGDGKAIISLDDGSAIRLNADSSVRLDSINPKNIEITNLHGEVYTRVVKADRAFAVIVDDEAYQAMGTAYKTVNSDTSKGVFVYESKVKVKKSATEVPEGKKLFKKYEADKNNLNKLLDITTEEIEKDTFTQWNKKEDLKNEEFKKHLGVLAKSTSTAATVAPASSQTATTTSTKPSETTPSAPTPTISLSGFPSTKGIELKWAYMNLDASKGFKLVKGSTANPVYPGNSATYISAGATSYSLGITDGNTYNFRICQYTGSGCGVYSNNIVVTAPKVADGVVSKIDLFTYSATQVKWYITGLSDLGVKVVWSKNPNPTYPTRTGDKYHYYSDQSLYKIDTLDAFAGPGTYYVRVCEYLGGACGVYSNEVQLNL